MLTDKKQKPDNCLIFINISYLISFRLRFLEFLFLQDEETYQSNRR